MYTHILGNSKFGKLLPEQVVKWMGEEMARRWEAYASANLPTGLTLHVDEEFYKIYNGYGDCKGDFGSCMSGGYHASFYQDAVKAHAAYLTDEDDMIVARCIIFDEVHDAETGEVFRLAERQYSSDGREILKRTLVQKLIDGGYIDGYKQVGAGCGEARAFVTNSGESMSDRKLWIDCDLDFRETLSYQDSFKSYDMDLRRADNFGDGEYELDSTDSEFEDDGDWSEYHEEYIDSDESIFVESRQDYFYANEVVWARVYDPTDGRFYEEDCFVEDCIRIGDDYYYAGGGAEYPEDHGICMCPECGEYFIPEDGCYSEFLEEDYCCAACAEKAENAWKADNGWHYSEYDNEYFEDESEVGVFFTGCYNGVWETKTISVDSLIKAEVAGNIIKIDDDYYSKLAAEQRVNMELGLVPEPAI